MAEADGRGRPGERGVLGEDGGEQGRRPGVEAAALEAAPRADGGEDRPIPHDVGERRGEARQLRVRRLGRERRAPTGGREDRGRRPQLGREPQPPLPGAARREDRAAQRRESRSKSSGSRRVRGERHAERGIEAKDTPVDGELHPASIAGARRSRRPGPS